MSHHDIEPILGLPEELPDNEQILWQGRPDVWRLGRYALHTRLVALYFAGLIVLRGFMTWTEGASPLATAGSVLKVSGLAALGWSLLVVIGWLSARATMYTITNRRVVLRIGIALPVTLNLPFVRLASAAMREDKSGHGDISLELVEPDRLAYLLLWPHVRPWRFSRPQPTLRAIPEVEKVGALLTEAMAQATLVRWAVEPRVERPAVFPPREVTTAP